MTEQASFWEQSDLLALIPPAGRAPAEPQSPVLSLEPPRSAAADAEAPPAVTATTLTASSVAADCDPEDCGAEDSVAPDSVDFDSVDFDAVAAQPGSLGSAPQGASPADLKPAASALLPAEPASSALVPALVADAARADSTTAAGQASLQSEPTPAVPEGSETATSATSTSALTTSAPAASSGPALTASPAAPVVSLPTLASAAGHSLPSCPERLLVLDTETTALSVEHGQCIEVGAVLFHVSSRAVLMQVSFLLPCPSNPAEAINGIPAPVSRLSQPWQAGLACFEAMVAAADALVAHNVAFDRQWFGQAPLPTLSKPWICSMEDIRWPADRQLRATPSVRDLALAYGIPVWAAHRALTDCIYLVQVFERCPQLELLLQAALEPRRLYRAQIGYAERHRAKEAGFRWNEPIRGAWSRRLSDREVEALGFAVEPVEALAGALPRTA